MRNITQIDSLTGLRGLAVGIVFVSHLSNEGMFSSIFSGGAGQVGVMLFFVLSAFLMTRIYLITPPVRRNVIKYLRARTLRVLPLYFLIVAVSALVTPYFENYRYPMNSLSQTAQHLTMIDGDYELWAIPIEVQFYLLFILLWVTSYRLKIGPGGNLLLLALLASIFLIIGFMQFAMISKVFGFPKFAMYFLLGSFIAICFPDNLRSLRRYGWISWMLSILAISVLTSRLPFFQSEVSGPTAVWADPIIFACIAIIFVLALNSCGIFAFISNPILMFFGKISYGFYLLHPIIINAALPINTSSALKVIIIFSLSTLLSVLSFYCFERPFSNLWKMRNELHQARP